MREIDPRDPEGSLKRMAERFPWLGLNPMHVSPAELVGIKNAKRDILAMQDLLGPRLRGIPQSKRVATLFSMPTERIGEATGRNCRYYAETTAQALFLDSHVPMDAVFEEQLASGRLDRYGVLIASGVEAVYDKTPSVIESWVRNGGTLVLNLEAFGLDEWGCRRVSGKNEFPGISVGERIAAESFRFTFCGEKYDAVPYKRVEFAAGSGWEIIASLKDGHVAVARRRIGKGAVYYVGVRFPVRGDEGRLLAAIAASRGIDPVCRTLDHVSDSAADGIEVHAARLENGDTGFVVINTSQVPRAVRFLPGKGFGSECIVDVSTRTILGRDKSGAVLLMLEPSNPIVLRGALSERRLAASLASAPAAWNPRKTGGFAREGFSSAYERVNDFVEYVIHYADGRSSTFEARAFSDFGDLRIDRKCSPPPESVDCVPGWIDRERRGLWVSKWINPFPEKMIASISIRSSGGFLPVIAGISAELPPEGFGVVENSFAGKKVRAWGGLKAKVEGEAVEIDFGQARDWAGMNIEWKESVRPPENSPSADFEFDITLEAGYVPDMQMRLAKGKYVTLGPFVRKVEKRMWRVSVPLDYSDRRDVRFISLQRRGNGGQGSARKIIIAGFRMVHRNTSDNPLELRRFDSHATDGARALRRDGGLELAVADNERHWASLQMRIASFMPLSEIAPDSDLVFEVNSGRTTMGMRGTGRQRLRVEAVFLTPQKKEKRQYLEKVSIDGGKIDDDPWSWQTVRVPFSSLVPEGVDTLQRFVMKLLDMPQDGRSGVVFRNLRFEKSKKVESGL